MNDNIMYSKKSVGEEPTSNDVSYHPFVVPHNTLSDGGISFYYGSSFFRFVEQSDFFVELFIKIVGIVVSSVFSDK